jgi:hypothetical protein
MFSGEIFQNNSVQLLLPMKGIVCLKFQQPHKQVNVLGLSMYTVLYVNQFLSCPLTIDVTEQLYDGAEGDKQDTRVHPSHTALRATTAIYTVVKFYYMCVQGTIGSFCE